MKPCNCIETENVKIGRYEVVICKECKSPLDVIGEPLVPLNKNELYKVMMVCSKQIPYKESYIISLDIPKAVKDILKIFGQSKTLSVKEIEIIIKDSFGEFASDLPTRYAAIAIRNAMRDES